MTTHRLTDATAALDFLHGGNATFTAVSRMSGTRFTYRVRKSEDGKLYFVSLMTGPDNVLSYTYMGIIRAGKFWPTAKSGVGPDAPSFKGFKWLYSQLSGGQLPDTVEFWHEGKCCRCGRPLTVPESIQSGIGPECSKRARRVTPQLALAV